MLLNQEMEHGQGSMTSQTECNLLNKLAVGCSMLSQGMDVGSSGRSRGNCTEGKRISGGDCPDNIYSH